MQKQISEFLEFIKKIYRQVFEGHGRGIQTLAWCGCDSSMLLSSSRDDHMICWNPNNTSVPGGEVRFYRNVKHFMSVIMHVRI